MTRLLRLVLPVLAAALPLGALAQPAPARYEILALDVEGGSEATSDDFVRQYSGLRVGQRVALPYDPALAEATKKLYRTGFFSDVEIVADRLLGDGVYLLIRVQEEPRLNQYTLVNVSGGDREDLEMDIPLLRGRPVRPSDIGRTVQVIERFYVDKGFRDVRVDVARAPAAASASRAPPTAASASRSSTSRSSGTSRSATRPSASGSRTSPRRGGGGSGSARRSTRRPSTRTSRTSSASTATAATTTPASS